jgi:Response regulators consisting of a CheY-like receiver domain and a winged-helix DNA-binding domain
MMATRLIRKKKDKLTHTPIIALTSIDLDEQKSSCSKAGMDDYLSKPIDKEEMIQKH